LLGAGTVDGGVVAGTVVAGTVVAGAVVVGAVVVVVTVTVVVAAGMVVAVVVAVGMVVAGAVVVVVVVGGTDEPAAGVARVATSAGESARSKSSTESNDPSEVELNSLPMLNAVVSDVAVAGTVPE
jgi:hypothetical protein